MKRFYYKRARTLDRFILFLEIKFINFSLSPAGPSPSEVSLTLVDYHCSTTVFNRSIYFTWVRMFLTSVCLFSRSSTHVSLL